MVRWRTSTFFRTQPVLQPSLAIDSDAEAVFPHRLNLSQVEESTAIVQQSIVVVHCKLVILLCNVEGTSL